MRVSLVLPPITQLNTPYPSTGFLSRVLREAGHSVAQRDLGIELATTLFSRSGLTQLFDRLEQISDTTPLPEFAWRSWTLRRQHI